MTAPDLANSELFAPLENHIRTEEHTDAGLFRFIATVTLQSARHGYAMAMHAADIIEEMGGEDLSYTDIVVHVYWRTFFSRDHAKTYHTPDMVDSPDMLDSFVRFCIDPSTVSAPHASLSSLAPVFH